MVMTAGYLMELICDPSIAVAEVIEVLGGELTPGKRPGHPGRGRPDHG